MITLNENKIKSFGKIYTNVFADNTLSVKAKGLYAYLCAYAGRNNSAYPSQNTILHELNISKKTFYKYVDELVEKNYISKKRNSLFQHTHYIIVAQVGNYGIVEKDIMRSDIDILGKAVYGYICAFAGTYNRATICIDNILHHLNVVYNTFKKGLSSIKNLISIKIENFCSSTYEIIAREKIHTENTTKKQKAKKLAKSKKLQVSETNFDNTPDDKKFSDFKNCDIKKCDIKNSPIKNYSTNNNNIINSNINNNNLHHQATQQIAKQEVLTQVGLSADNEEDTTVKTIIDVMVKTYNSKNETLTVAKEKISKNIVIAKLKEVTPQIFKEIIQAIRSSRTKIYNIYSYILTVLYNAPTQYDLQKSKKTSSHKGFNDVEYETTYDIAEYEEYDIFDGNHDDELQGV